jgi:hypothetical protein
MSTLLALPPAGGLGEADLLWRGPLEREFGRVLQHQDRAIRRADPKGRSCEVTGQDIVFADIFIREEPVGRFRIRPILERRGQGFPRPLTQGGKHRSQPPVQTHIAQITSYRLILRPTSHASTPSIQMPENES